MIGPRKERREVGDWREIKRNKCDGAGGGEWEGAEEERTRNEGITKSKSRTKRKRKQLRQRHVWAVCAGSPSLVSAQSKSLLDNKGGGLSLYFPGYSGAPQIKKLRRAARAGESGREREPRPPRLNSVPMAAAAARSLTAEPKLTTGGCARWPCTG